MNDATKTADVMALVERLRKLSCWLALLSPDPIGVCEINHDPEDAAAMLTSLAAERDAARKRAEAAERERDQARAVLAAADKGTPIYKAVERILDEHSAWIARPSDDVTKAIALAAGVAWMTAEKVDPSLDEMDRALSEARAALAAAQAEAEKLREALKPFAREADNVPTRANDDDRPPIGYGSQFDGHGGAYVGPGSETSFTVGDLRRARAALAQGGRDDA